MKAFAHVLVFAAIGLFADPIAALAQARHGDDAAVEIWGAMAAALAGPTGTVVSDYSPPLLLDGNDFTSRGAQTLTIDTMRAPGVTGGVNVFPLAHFGIQVLVDRASFGVSGTNTPYVYTLTYVSRQPPDNVPQTFTIGDTVAWPDTSGSVTQLSMALNAVARIGSPSGFNVTLSGGPTIAWLTGTAEPLGYTAFNMGGHAVLFSNQYRLAMEIDRAHAFGFDAGGEFNAPVGRHLAVVVGYRYFDGGDVDVTATAKQILNPDVIGLSQSLDDIASRIAPVHGRLSTSGSRALVGLKVRY